MRSLSVLRIIALHVVFVLFIMSCSSPRHRLSSEMISMIENYREQRLMRDTERYSHADSNALRAVTEFPVSTFSIDVDTASYANVRRFLKAGRMPSKDAVRIEELVNYFSYEYPSPKDKKHPFSVNVNVVPTPWNPDTKLFHIGIKGYDIPHEKRPKANLVFLIDVSGSMGEENKLPLLQKSLKMLVDKMSSSDTIAIVTYAGVSRVALKPTPGSERNQIVNTIDGLISTGGTHGEGGIRKAYELAETHFDAEAVNRIILCTDGDFNLGVTRDESLEDLVARKRKTGIYLSVLGFGTRNLDDRMMQTLAQAGNGNAAYIDSLLEARKVLSDEASSTLFPIANDVKIQVEFNPARVVEYRLIGYETRMLKREDFSNDQVDAGEIGSGHTVTALYEIAMKGSKGQRLEPLRYQPKKPNIAPGNELYLARDKVALSPPF